MLLLIDEMLEIASVREKSTWVVSSVALLIRRLPVAACMASVTESSVPPTQ